jgi:O-antigen/teichoic acid export membrane protein
MADVHQLDEPAAGRRALRGGGLRVAGYGVNAILTAATSVILLRYLSVEGFGAYVTVTSLVAIVAGITEAGLGLVAQREWIAAEDDAARADVISTTVGVRLVITPVALGLALLFGVAAGYSHVLLAGIAIAGAGVLIVNVASSLSVPLVAQLRLGIVTAADLARAATILLALAVMVVAGASLSTLFLAHVAGGVAMAAVTIVALHGTAPLRPTFDWQRWRPLLAAALPMAVATVVNVIYLRALVVLMSLLAGEREVGLFATSFRIIEVFAGVPVLMMGAAFPILVRAGSSDEPRLAYALQRMVEAGLLVGGLAVLVLVAAADPIVVLLGGHGYEDAAPVLQIQAFALLGVFLSQVFALGLVAVHRQRALALANLLALVTGLGAGLILIPASGATGAAVAAIAGELGLSTICLVALLRARPNLRPSPGRPLRVLLALALGIGAGLPLPDIAGAAVGIVVFVGAAALLRAIPAELFEALRRPAQPSES